MASRATKRASIADSLCRAIDRRLRKDPDRPVVLSPRRTARARDVDTSARNVHDLLVHARLRPGLLVAFAAENGPGYLAGFLALRRAGLAVLVLDADTPVPEQHRIAQRFEAAALLLLERAWPEESRDWSLEILGRDRPSYSLDGTAVVKLSSGSTGEPRGIALSSEALLADSRNLAKAMRLSPDDRLLATVPFSHSYGFSVLALPALAFGMTLIHPDGEDALSTPLGRRATVLPSVPSWWRAILQTGAAWPRSLRLLLSAGAPLAPETARGIRELCGRPIHVLYGASECGAICFDRRGGAAERGTVGRPLPGVRVRLESEPDMPGRRLVRVESAAVGLRYVPDPDARLERGNHLSADLAEWDRGELRLLGRTNTWINVNGRKVDPLEVEKVLSGLPGVREVAVIGRPVVGRASEQVRAVIACAPDGLRWLDVVAWCRERLASHKVPRSVILVPTLPRNSRGKLDRSALLSLQADPGLAEK